MPQKKIIALILGILISSGISIAETQESLLETLLSLDKHEKMKINEGREKGLLDLQPVILPEGENLVGVNKWFSHPVATMVDDTIIVAFIRNSSHWQQTPDEHSSPCLIIRSLDGGKTWGKPVDMRKFRKGNSYGKSGMGFGTAMCVDENKIVYLVSSIGVFRSLDKGVTWEHFPDAFTDKQLSGPKTNNGASLLQHPEYGLVVFGHDVTKGVFPADNIYIRYSQDKGRTWNETVQEGLPPSIKPIEPTAMMYKGQMIIMARSHGSFNKDLDAWFYSMLYSENGWLPLKSGLSNIQASDIKHWKPYEGKSSKGNFGAWSQDTVDISLNPCTNRIEIVAANRNGGGQGKERVYSHMTLNLWSIDPEKLLAGDLDWRFEGTLLSREGTYATKPKKENMHWDGMHPGGAVIDTKNNVQHIFIYLGYTSGPSGIFQLTRSLDTEKLSPWLKDRN